MSRTAAVEMLPPRAASAGEPALPDPFSADGCLVSEEVYWRDYYDLGDICYEWNNGRLEEKPVSDFETNLLYAWLLDLLRRYLETRPHGQIAVLDTGFRLPLASGTRIRRPDLAVVRGDNPHVLAPRDCSFKGIYDLCIEALSDLERADIERDTVTKKAEYAAGGVAEYYILHHDPQLRAFYRRAPTGHYVPIAPRDGVIASRTLPGFRFRLADLDARRPLVALSADPVYADFVLPQWQQDRQRADTEAQRAAAEAVARRESDERADTEATARRAADERAAAEAAARLAADERAAAESRARREAEARAESLAQRLAELEARLDAPPPDRQGGPV